MNYLIVGLGNPGEAYSNTRHNIGFMVLDALASKTNCHFEAVKYAEKAQFRLAGRTFILIKPNTFMNLSGKAVRYWLSELNIPIDQLLVITDDLALPFGKIRLKAKGSDGGHNGLKSIQELLNTQLFARLRMGIDANFSKGKQADYVLSAFSADEQAGLADFVQRGSSCVEQFGLLGLPMAMNTFNK